MRRGEAIVQTYAPDHPVVRFAAAHDYDGFADNRTRRTRAAAGFPPSARAVYLGVLGRNRRRVEQTAQTYADLLRASNVADVLGPGAVSDRAR